MSVSRAEPVSPEPLGSEPLGSEPVSRAGELSRTRAARGLSQEDCRIWFGVDLATLERVEAGEVVPGEELERRIDRFLRLFGQAR